MKNNNFLYNEILKNKADKELSEKELEDFKNQFAKDMSEKYGKHMVDSLNNVNRNNKVFKKSFKMKMQDFFNKLKYIFG